MDSHKVERRWFLQAAGASLVFAACSSPPPAAPLLAGPSPEQEAHDARLLNQGIALEQGAILVYQAAAGLDFLKEDQDVLRIAGLFRGQHEEHRDALAQWVRALGGAPVELAQLLAPPLPPLILDEAQPVAARRVALLEFARRLERQAADAYFHLIAAELKTDFARRSALEILPVEAQHVAVFDAALGRAMPVNAALFSSQT